MCSFRALHFTVQSKNNDTMENKRGIRGIRFIFKFGILKKEFLRVRVETPLKDIQ